jgi:hypothetical protein
VNDALECKTPLPSPEAELGCRQDKIDFSRIDEETIVAKGCEKQATYVRVCRTRGSFGTCGDVSPQWLKSSETVNTGAAPK